MSLGHQIGIAGLIIHRLQYEHDTNNDANMQKTFHANRIIDAINQQQRTVAIYDEGSPERRQAVLKLQALELQRDEWMDMMATEAKQATTKAEDRTSNKIAGVDDVIEILSSPAKKIKTESDTNQTPLKTPTEEAPRKVPEPPSSPNYELLKFDVHKYVYEYDGWVGFREILAWLDVVAVDTTVCGDTTSRQQGGLLLLLSI